VFCHSSYCKGKKIRFSASQDKEKRQAIGDGRQAGNEPLISTVKGKGNKKQVMINDK